MVSLITPGECLQIFCTISNTSTNKFLPVSYSSKADAKCISRSYHSLPTACFCERSNCRILAIALFILYAVPPNVLLPRSPSLPSNNFLLKIANAFRLLNKYKKISVHVGFPCAALDVWFAKLFSCQSHLTGFPRTFNLEEAFPVHRRAIVQTDWLLLQMIRMLLLSMLWLSCGLSGVPTLSKWVQGADFTHH